MSKRQMFFKSVRSDYSSLYARNGLSRIYTVGSHHKFSAKLPAHVFTLEESNRSVRGVEGTLNSDLAYDYRAEGKTGNRVVICYGLLKKREVPCLCVSDSEWNFTEKDMSTETKWTSTEFTVIGEIALPQTYFGVRPVEIPYNLHLKQKNINKISGLDKFLGKQ